jgi:hypothetical protein
LDNIGFMVRIALLSALGLALSGPVWAQSGPLPAGISSYAPADAAPIPAWEARFGAGLANPGGREGGLANLGAELVTPRLSLGTTDRFTAALLPRFNLGSSINLNGTRYAYAGASWTLDVSSSVFLEASLGAAINDGKTGPLVPLDRLAVGCNTGARGAAALGFRLNERWSLVATLEHFNALSCSDKPQVHNPSNFGARLGYTF